jgi:allantoate deiminase
MNDTHLTTNTDEISAVILSHIDSLAAISAAPNALTRLYLSEQHRRAADLLLGWMRDAGMTARMDAVGNICGRYEGKKSALPALLLGSHYDTVRNAGKWDGPLGLITAIACVAEFNRRGQRFPFAIEVVGFADEEGVRFPVALTGSRAFAGTLPESALSARDADGVSMRDAMVKFGLDPDHIGAAARIRGEFLGYVELHIEQGPVLELENEPVGVVTAISGATRLSVQIEGLAGHAGTVPMRLRRDALAGAAECVLAIEQFCRMDDTLVGTVGYLNVQPGATNVIPGQASFTVDIRAVSDEHRRRAVADIVKRIESIAERRRLKALVAVTHETPTVGCAPWLRRQIAAAVQDGSARVIELPSGAGHDGMAVHSIADIAMIFVRCRGGVSHNPAEHVEPGDVAAGAKVLLQFVENFRPASA